MNEITSLDKALVATGFSYLSELRSQAAELLQSLIGSIGDIRRCGSAALDLCNVASGRVDAFYEDPKDIWDIAAGVVIAREAGAIVTDMKGNEPGSSVLAAPAAIHDKLLAALSR